MNVIFKILIVNKGLIHYTADYINRFFECTPFNGDFFSIPKCTGSCEYLFREIPGILVDEGSTLHLILS